MTPETARSLSGHPPPSATLGPRPLVPSRFLERPNRFLVRCRLEAGSGRRADGGPVVDAHLPDPGRLRELLRPWRRVWLRPEPGGAGRRRTGWTAALVETPDREGLVSVDTTVPNRLVEAALEAGALEELARWELERREVSLGGSRLDFLLRDRSGTPLALEVKSVTLVEDGVGLFPDAVTARGARHVRELASLAGREGWEAAVLFVVQRPDARRIRAAREIDPDFADALAEAKAAGVRVLGRRCRVRRDRVELGPPVPAA